MKKASDWNEEGHPSYGVIQISRVNGQTTLFRSSLKHHNFIALRIGRAKVVDTGGAYDFTMESSDGQIVEVWMSETQFARAITSLNMGSGAPCTLTRVGVERIEEPPVTDRAEFVESAHDNHLEDHCNGLAEMRDKVAAWREAKHRPTMKELDEMLHEMRVVSDNFAANSAYYRDRFKEDVEGIVDDAKTEIEAHITATANRLGVEQLKDVPRVAEPCHKGGLLARSEDPCPANTVDHERVRRDLSVLKEHGGP